MPWQVQAVPQAVLSGQANIYVQPTAPTGTIPVNSIWYNTTPANQSLNTWNGTSWVQIAVPGTNLISAGTIVAALIAAGTIVAGIVDGTTVTGGTFIVGPAGSEQLKLTTDGSGNGIITYTMPSALITDGKTQCSQTGAGSAVWGSVFTDGPARTAAGHTDFVTLALNGSDGTSSANLGLYYHDASGGLNNLAYVDYSGFNAICGGLNARKPGTGTSSTNPAQIEPWNNLSLATGLSAGGFRYRMLVEASCMVIDMTVQWTTTAAATFTFPNLPAAYSVPSTGGLARIYTCNGNATETAAGQLVRLFLSGTSVQLIVPATTAGGTVSWSGIVPLV
jgi:hypothetical protein